MFGYLTVNAADLTKEQKQTYRQYYCGLCDALKKQYGLLGSSTLSFDLTFVGMLFSSLYKENYASKTKCPFFPLASKNIITSKYLDYASKMNIFLTYYKAIDDANDDNNQSQKRKAKKLEKFVKEIQNEYPKQTSIMINCLNKITTYESQNETNPDLPANEFGLFMAQLFSINDDKYTKDLESFGFYLGKFIYLMDAVVDFKDDIKKERFNPLISIDSQLFEDILQLNISKASGYYEALNIEENKNILDNIIYSGTWNKYNLKKGVYKNGRSL